MNQGYRPASHTESKWGYGVMGVARLHQVIALMAIYLRDFILRRESGACAAITTERSTPIPPLG